MEGNNDFRFNIINYNSWNIDLNRILCIPCARIYPKELLRQPLPKKTYHPSQSFYFLDIQKRKLSVS